MAAPSSFIPLAELLPGYPKLAGQMGLLPEIAIFRRFSALNAQNLLYLQAELVWLEKKLRKVESEDNKDYSKSRYALDWFWLSQSDQLGNNDASEQLSLVREISLKLKQYNDAVIQQSLIHSMPEPSKWDLNDIQHYLATDEMGPLNLIGDDACTWGSIADRKSHSPDLVALRPRHKEDWFSNFLTKKVTMWLFRCGLARFKKPSRVLGVVGYKDSTVFRITYCIATLVASLLPVASIAVLYYVQAMKARLAIIAAFCLIISCSLSVFTTATRSEVFTATAAFSAVMVVFVGSSNSVSHNSAAF
ncbi:hypothetical protein BU16DRAFT_531983 [Lophium mytilinum]|uniref:DUF6594 domain-containing protein n=1 Tax=Lophium mytilinum TaxID=390894 RepID=A0A6A6QA65_9PEZI|nr:hypothetical protein BU16DRAFT_531983 [Lophium mytilinum]